MKKFLPIIIVLILAVIGWLVFGKRDGDKISKQEPATSSEIQISDFDTNDYLDQALEDLEALETLE